MIKFIKKDYKNVKDYLEYKLNRKIPVAIFVLYYVIVGLIALPFVPLILIYHKIKLKMLLKKGA